MRKREHDQIIRDICARYDRRITLLSAEHKRDLDLAEHAREQAQDLADKYGNDLNTVDRRMWRYYKALQALGVDPGRLWDDPPDDRGMSPDSSAVVVTGDIPLYITAALPITEHALPGCTCEYGECWDQDVVDQQVKADNSLQAANYRYEPMPRETLHTGNPYEY